MKRRILITAGVRWWNASAHYAVDLARALSAEGHEVVVAARRGTPAAERACRAGLEVDQSFDFRPRYLARDVRAMVKLLRRRPFDVLNPHRAPDQNVLLVARRIARIRTPLLRTRVDVKEFRPNPANIMVYGRLVNGIVAPGECSRKLLVERYRLPPWRVETVHGGVYTTRFCPERRSSALRESLGIGGERVAVGIVARLGKIKGHIHFFEAIARLRARGDEGRNGGHPAYLVIGPETDYTIAELRALAERMGVPDVVFTGYRDDIAEVTAGLDIGVLTSTGSEAHCRVGLEMLASGVPVVGTQVGVIPEIVSEGVNGYVVPACDGAALAERIALLLDSAPRRDAFGAAARQSALECYAFDHWAHRTEEAFDRLACEMGRFEPPQRSADGP